MDVFLLLSFSQGYPPSPGKNPLCTVEKYCGIIPFYYMYNIALVSPWVNPPCPLCVVSLGQPPSPRDNSFSV